MVVNKSLYPELIVLVKTNLEKGVYGNDSIEIAKLLGIEMKPGQRSINKKEVKKFPPLQIYLILSVFNTLSYSAATPHSTRSIAPPQPTYTVAIG